MTTVCMNGSFEGLSMEIIARDTMLLLPASCNTIASSTEVQVKPTVYRGVCLIINVW
jgi:uncharacterized protein with ATP-grasp and redox domains